MTNSSSQKGLKECSWNYSISPLTKVIVYSVRAVHGSSLSDDGGEMVTMYLFAILSLCLLEQYIAGEL